MSILRGSLIAAALLIGAATGSARAAESVWWEGEAPAETNFPAKTPFSAATFEATRDEVLSAGDWLTNAGPRKGPEAFARYGVTVPADGDYALWARKFWRFGPFRWRFDAGEWRTCGADIGLADSVTIRTHLGANWVYLGRIRLAKGLRTFEIRLLAGPGETLTACFDCFLATTGSFLPRGKLQPGQHTSRREAGWWAADPDADPFGEAALDLRYLNERTAGERGFVTRKGDRLLAGGEHPVRFWGVNCGPMIVALGDEPVRYLARRLARAGVNCVRFHGSIFDRTAKDPTTVDAVFLRRLHFFVAAMKAEGIYTTLSFYFPLWFAVRPEDGLPGFEATRNKKPYSLLFFDPRMQELWRAWARALLTTKNPFTGIPLVKDPAVALVEIQNEDSFLFWTFKPGETIPLPRVAALETEFARWLARRHGTLAKAREHWNGARHERDGEDRAGLFDIWHLTGRGAGSGAHRLRASDQLRFLVEKQRGFYAETVKWLRDDLGVKCAISASNWKTADPVVLGALERYSYQAADVLDRHGYFGGMHRGDGASYSVRVGHEYKDRAAVFEIGATPAVGVATAGFPDIVSEIGWPDPNRFRADFPLLLASLGSWLGTDGYFFFAIGGMGWLSPPNKFAVNVPTVLGQFPGCALLYRTGIVAEGPVAAVETLDLDTLCGFGGTKFANVPNLDALRDPGRETGDPDRLPFLTGRVVQTWRPARVTAPPGKPGFTWDRKNGLFSLDRPRAKAVTGFLRAAGRIEVGGVTIQSRNEYGTILVVALDGLPIGESKRVLVQAMTEERPFGFQTAKGRITSVGGYPMLVRRVDAEVRFKRRFRKATVLDMHGYARETEQVSDRLKLPEDAIYTILE